jgi:uncharacterized protein YwbE
MDGRHKRRERSAALIRAAVERLLVGQGTHPMHVGIKVRLTKQAVAREARISSATLYRFPQLLRELESTTGGIVRQKLPAAEQRRRVLIQKIKALENDNQALIDENARLTRELAKYDPSLGVPQPIALDERRIGRTLRPHR